ncbi:MAG TPA: ATP-binding protein [Negativicutes bacterium]|nr:ATP-binding protein [Negativicutes bacterium]
MFSRIRRQLTFLYTVLSALALGSFALLFYFGFAHLLMHEQEHEMEAYAVRASREVREMLKRGAPSRDKGERANPAEFPVETSYFVFAVRSNGAVIIPPKQDPAIRPPAEVLVDVKVDKKPVVYAMDRGTEPAARFLWMIMAIQEDGQYRGSVVVGRDLSPYDHFLQQMSLALWGSLVAFLLVSGLIGYFAAGRAISPIRRSFETQRRFAADASHELRTPLSVIQASLDVVEKEDGERLSPLSRQIFDDLKDEVRRMSRLTGNLLTLARADAGGLELNLEQFGVGEVAEHVFRAMRPLAQAKGVEIERSIRQDTVLQADKDRILQLLMILVDNGIKFTPAGGRVTMRIDRENNGAIILEVADTGIGLSPEDRHHVFERFYRVDKARSREAGGAGLGLSIAAWIAEAHGGKIEAQAGTAGGSAFRVVLPQNCRARK